MLLKFNNQLQKSWSESALSTMKVWYQHWRNCLFTSKTLRS